MDDIPERRVGLAKEVAGDDGNGSCYQKQDDEQDKDSVLRPGFAHGLEFNRATISCT